jgi:hypothetical protein
MRETFSTKNMILRRWATRIALGTMALASALTSSASAEEYAHRFDGASTLGWTGWHCSLTNPASGGNPGGHLRSCNDQTYIWFLTSHRDFIGNYGKRAWVLNFDLKSWGTRRAGWYSVVLWGDPQKGGWVYDGEWEARGQDPTSAPSRDPWKTLAVPILGFWTDQEAQNAGWHKIHDGAVSWAELMQNVTSIRIEARPPGGAPVTPDVDVGLDNVVLRAP